MHLIYFLSLEIFSHFLNEHGKLSDRIISLLHILTLIANQSRWTDALLGYFIWDHLTVTVSKVKLGLEV
jgi:hypothetical protein